MGWGLTDYTTTRENWELRPAFVTEAISWDYTTTRENWELRPFGAYSTWYTDYTTTRENWELRPFTAVIEGKLDYTTTRENWELRLIHWSSSTSQRLYHYERKLGTTTQRQDQRTPR